MGVKGQTILPCSPEGHNYIPAHTSSDSADIHIYVLADFFHEERWTNIQQDETFVGALSRIVALSCVLEKHIPTSWSRLTGTLARSLGFSASHGQQTWDLEPMIEVIKNLVFHLEQHFLSPDDVRRSTEFIVQLEARKIVEGLVKVSACSGT